ncbi:MAG: exodeoxyribonuclease III [Candidatus Krumholzibacteriia bacterium]
MQRIISWNVNGLRAVYKKGFLGWLDRERPDALCVQEVRAEVDQLPAELAAPAGYHAYFTTGHRKGYSGVGLYTRQRPASVDRGIGIERFDVEGRFAIADYGAFLLYNVYFPNGSASAERLDFKLAFYDAFLEHVTAATRAGRKVIVCGDLNTAHREIDLARPEANENNSGFLPQERDWIDRFIAGGFVDTFRMFHPGPGHYTYWDFKTRARARNAGWRIDYFFISANLESRVKDAFILSEVPGSDHCPIGINIDI